MIRELARATVDYSQRGIAWCVDLVFPIQCIGCKILAPRHPYLCRKCFSDITVRQASECIGCKSPITLGTTCTFCRPHSFVDQLLIIAPYDQALLGKALSTWKYRFVDSLAVPLHALTKKYLHQMHNRHRLNVFRNNPVIIPVPLSRRRHNLRGFNQAELLAQRLSKTFQISIATDALARIRHTTPQVQAQDRASRLSNLAGAFHCTNPDPIKGRVILLIDDVCTTGATLDECARVLKSAGAAKVAALVIARG